MRSESTSYSGSHQDANNAESIVEARLRTRRPWLARALGLAAAMAFGALLLALAYQIPVTHAVDVGGYDSAYVQGFFDPERASPAQSRPELIGSDGGARWTRDSSFLLFPQAGLPARVTLRLRGWRPRGAPPHVTILLNGTQTLTQFQTSPDWQDYDVTIDGGLLKPNDVVIEIRSETAQLDQGDPRAVGVLLDRATYQAGPAPIVPYPPQLAYGALAAGLLYLLLVDPSETRRPGHQETMKPRHALLVSLSAGLLVWMAGVIALAIAFLALYRAQPPYPYPLLRLLPAVDAILAALLAARYGPAIARRAPALLDAAALGGIGVWLAAVLAAARNHLTLAVPGVEKDFRVFALRSAHLGGQFPAGTNSPDLDGVFRADGFYNLGYPLLLWLARPLANDNPFLAARLVAALSGALLLIVTWWLARRLLGRGPALLAAALLALSPLAVEYALYIGTDMPFAAACALALALIVAAADGRRATKDQRPELAEIQGASLTSQASPAGGRRLWLAVGAGLAGGLAFLIRHPGLLLLPFGWLALWMNARLEITNQARLENAKRKTQNAKRKIGVLLPFTLAFLLAIAPQVFVNMRDTGSPLYSQQAKNVWQGVFGQGDWGRWAETANDVGIGQVVVQDPARFLANWWSNARGYFGTGGEDTREFGQALQLRLLGFPANWLAIAGLLGWLAVVYGSFGQGEKETRGQGKKQLDNRSLALPPFRPLAYALLLLWIALYVAAVSVGLPLQPRFVLPLAPIYAVAAAWLVMCVTANERPPTADDRRPKAEESNQEPTFYIVRSPFYALCSTFAILALLALLWGGFGTGAGYALRLRPADETAIARAESRAELPGQPADEAGIIRLALATLRPSERLVVRASPDSPLGKYSAIAHLVAPAPAADTPEALRASGASYLIWSSALGRPPSVGSRIGDAGIYTLYRIER